MKRLATVTLTLLFLIPFGAAAASPADLNINGDQLRAEADAEQRAEFDACMAELQSGAMSLQLCMPQWAPAPTSTTTSTTTTTTTTVPAVEESVAISDEETPAPTTTTPAKPAPTTTTVPAADPPADDGHGYDYEPPELGDDEFYIVPVEGRDEVALIPVPVGDCINDRWSEQGIDPTHPEFTRLLAEFFAANLGPCMEEHGF